MSGKVYVVTSGCDSDYGIEAVFSTEAAAKKFISEAFNERKSEDANIEEYELDVPESEWTGHFIRMSKLGEVLDHSPVVMVSKSSWHEQPGFDVKGNLIYSVAGDLERAIKVANEYRTRVLTNGTWGKR